MRKLILAAAALSIATFAVASPSFAQAADPTMNQVYEAARSGHIDHAQQMITQVLADHPNSAKAHYVQAELFARERKFSLGRIELSNAERLNPGLTEFTPQSVQELKAQLNSPGPRAASAPRIVSVPARSVPHFPWGGLIVGLIAIGLLMMLFRRRAPYSQNPVAGPGAPGAPTGYGPGYGPAPMGGGGIGSGIAGGLASGLAVGAGVVAGEELAHHFLDGGQRDGGVIPSADAAVPDYNSDMGGADFGANDAGSWDDGGGLGGGGDDWS